MTKTIISTRNYRERDSSRSSLWRFVEISIATRRLFTWYHNILGFVWVPTLLSIKSNNSVRTPRTWELPPYPQLLGWLSSLLSFLYRRFPSVTHKRVLTPVLSPKAGGDCKSRTRHIFCLLHYPLCYLRDARGQIWTDDSKINFELLNVSWWGRRESNSQNLRSKRSTYANSVTTPNSRRIFSYII